MDTTSLLKASVVIPTWNGAKRIIHTLEALAEQTCSPEIFEVIIVDNNSTDPELQTTESHPGVSLLRQRGVSCRVVNETRSGLLFARLCGITSAQTDIVCFLDDDTEPATSYLATGMSAFADKQLGVLVSRVFPKYEQIPTHSIIRREHLLAINQKLGDEIIDWGSGATMAPTLGAGMWVRRSAFLQSVPWQQPELLISDRKGGQLISGGDIEIGYLIGRAGYKRVYLPALQLLHLIPKNRLHIRYFCRLIIGVVRSQITLYTRYGIRQHGFRWKALALARLGGAIAAIPWLITRPDCKREILFVLAYQWANFVGPYEQN